ncbi:MAG: hypothetical protein IH986_16145 [Planctomycetes bacterium]|nr:hypothetical protein [Planctomycetota bacterium]
MGDARRRRAGDAMPDWLDFQDPLVRKIVYAAIGLLVLTIVLSMWNRFREARYYARRRKELRKTQSAVELRQREAERLGVRIIATSSTNDVAGFEIVRQIEAVFTEGHPSPAKAVEMLKALAAQKGANAIINLAGERPPGSKCVARGDAVIVRSLQRRSRAEQAGPTPTDSAE